MGISKCNKCRDHRKKCIPSNEAWSKCKRCDDLNHPCSGLIPPHEYQRRNTIFLAPQETIRSPSHSAPSMQPFTNIPRETAIECPSSLPIPNGLMLGGFVSPSQGAVGGLQSSTFAPMFAGGDRYYEPESIFPPWFPPEFEQRRKYAPARVLDPIEEVAGEASYSEYLPNHQESEYPVDGLVSSDVEAGSNPAACSDCVENPTSRNKDPNKGNGSNA